MYGPPEEGTKVDEEEKQEQNYQTTKRSKPSDVAKRKVLSKNVNMDASASWVGASTSPKWVSW